MTTPTTDLTLTDLWAVASDIVARFPSMTGVSVEDYQSRIDMAFTAASRDGFAHLDTLTDLVNDPDLTVTHHYRSGVESMSLFLSGSYRQATIRVHVPIVQGEIPLVRGLYPDARAVLAALLLSDTTQETTE